MKATFGAGCFWGVQAAFDKFSKTNKCIIKTMVGFMGGNVDKPSYEKVCSGKTGHVEVCQIDYDQKNVSYSNLLEIFWEIHDPTQVDRQGPDIGEQYRSVIFYHSEKQKVAAEKSKQQMQKQYKQLIVTKIEPAQEFWKAEEYHQNYNEKHGNVC